MKGIPGRQHRGLPIGARLECVDNTGAKQLQIISVLKTGNVLNRLQAAGVGDMVMASVKKGSPQMRRQIVNAIVVRQRRPFRRADGTMVQFEDNAAVVVHETGETKGSEIKGAVAREAADRWPRIAVTASTIV